ncbi:MAG: valine--tRNA ligase [Candidatus Vogelbacteria bacterium]|nr:valine--tRNA ligase [Candidatus Vogelbacteria bacterium]
MSTDEKLTKPYNPKDTEPRIYDLWEKSGYFSPNRLGRENAEPYTIIMPPPNANGSLHAGHAVFVTIEDLIIRYQRMRGKRALWLPGADHAGFETQVVYEKKLEKEGRTRFGMDRDELYKEILTFTLSNKEFMENQLRQLGASCDWSREKFTLDPKVIDIVYDTFEQLYKDGLAYRGSRSINWCTKHQTSLSELETMSVDREDPLYYMKFGPFTLATVRPETKFGDTALAVNPTDERYKEWVGKEIEFEGLIGTIKLRVIADDYVDKTFGTGVVKITPAHDPNDFAVAQRHNLAVVEVIDQFGKLNEKCGKYAGLKVEEARKIVAEDMKKVGMLVKVDEKYKHAVKVCYKCERTLEPRVLPQWFVRMKPLAEAVIPLVEDETIKFYPDHYKKIMLHWLRNIEDWNVSRQIVWGIPIPVWYRDDEIIVSKDSPVGEDWIKETDTFDTWFSSGQWPFATLGYPDEPDYKNFYPTQVMETAGEIIFFWVARMIMFGKYRTGKLPFKDVYLHGIVTARDGKKMSKSKGNVISPIELSDKYGTDALRMGLIIGNTPGTTTALYEEKIRAYKLFANKLWNVSRYVSDNTEETIAKPRLTEEDEALIKELNGVIHSTTKNLDNYRFYIAAEELYHYVWHNFADIIIEQSKSKLKSEDKVIIESKNYTLRYILMTCLRLLHPFMPFITEEIWQTINYNPSILMVEEWPKA